MLNDVSPVLDAAYSDTSVGVRQQLEEQIKLLEKKIVNTDSKILTKGKYDHLKFKNDDDFQKYMNEIKMKYGIYSDAEIRKIKYNEAFQKDMQDWLKAHPDLAQRAKEKRENND